MIFTELSIPGVYRITPELRTDARGSFARSFCVEEFAKNGIDFTIVQANRSVTKDRGMIRGMHFQKNPHAEGKIVECLRGAVYDVVIDLREGSASYGKWLGVELNPENHFMLFVPKGFAHGFQTLTNDCEMQYFMSAFYAPDSASGVRYNDPFFNITWPLPNPILSEKDTLWPLL